MEILGQNTQTVAGHYSLARFECIGRLGRLYGAEAASDSYDMRNPFSGVFRHPIASGIGTSTRFTSRTFAKV
jgi:hypothetical protein